MHTYALQAVLATVPMDMETSNVVLRAANLERFDSEKTQTSPCDGTIIVRGLPVIHNRAIADTALTLRTESNVIYLLNIYNSTY